MEATFLAKDNNWQDGTTIYWFALDGHDKGTDKEFEDEEFGIVYNGPSIYVVDYSGNRLYNELVTNIVKRECIVTDKMIAM